MAKMTSRWRLLSCGAGDARTPLGLIFLSACDVIECVGLCILPWELAFQRAPFLLYLCWGKEARRRSLLLSWRGQNREQPIGLMCVCACECVTVGGPE